MCDDTAGILWISRMFAARRNSKETQVSDSSRGSTETGLSLMSTIALLRYGVHAYCEVTSPVIYMERKCAENHNK